MSESKSLFGSYHEMVHIWARIQAFGQVFKIQFFSLGVTSEACSKTQLTTRKIQDREHFEVLSS